MASSTINIKIKELVEGKQQVKDATLDLRDLAGAADRVHQAMSKKGSPFNAMMINAAACSTALQGLQGSLASLSEGYNSFDQSMRAANTMAGKNAEGFEAMKSQITELSKTIPLAREALASGLYQVISNGVPEDNWISYLEASAKSAVGGIADLGEVVKVTSTIIKNYGLDWESALDVQDKIQLTAKLGVTSFEQLAAALPSVTGQAAQLGVSLDEMLAVMSTLTGVTGNTAEVSTQLASVLTALTKESSKSQKMAEAMGISFNAASIKAAGGLRNFLQELDETVTAYAAKTGELRESIYSKLFGRAEALRMVNALTGELASAFDDKIAAMADSVGTIDEAFADMSKTSTSKAQLMRNAWAGVTDAMGKAANMAKPFLAPLAQIGQATLGVTSLAGAFRNMGGAATKAAASVRALGAAQALLRLGAIGAAIGVVAGAYMVLTQRSREAAEAQRVALREMQERSKGYSNITQAAAEYGAQERRTIDQLYSIITDETKSRKERNQAIGEMNRLYPEFFNNMSIEQTDVRTLANEYDKLKTKILKVAEARAANDKLTENARRRIELEDEREAAETALKEAQKEYEANVRWSQTPTSSRARGQIAGAGQMVTLPFSAAENEAEALLKAAQDNVEAKQREVDLIDQELANLDAADAKLAAKINGATTTTGTGGGTGGSGGGTTTTTAKAEEVIPDFDEVKGRALNSLEDYGNALKDLRKIEQKASKEKLGEVREWIKNVEAQQKAFEGIVATPDVTLEDVTKRQLSSINDIDTALRDLQTLRDNAAFDEIKNIQAIIDKLKEERDMRLGIAKDTENVAKTEEKRSKGAFDSIAEGWGSIKGVASGIKEISRVNDENASTWDKVASAVDGAIGIYQSINAVIKILQELGIISQASAAQQAAAAATSATAATTDATAQITDAAAKTLNAHSWIPFVGIALGAAGVAAMIATMAGLPKFAEGGIAYGPTLGLFGEYSGASTNPEVVAPLDKLRDLIGDEGDGMPRTVEVKLRGRDLIGAIEANTRYNSRTR